MAPAGSINQKRAFLLNDMFLLVGQADWVLLALAVFVLDIPRYTISLVSLVLMQGLRRPAAVEARAGVTVSVILPAFNGGTGLLQSLASLHGQTLKPLEIIVVDDGSTDETLAMAEQARAAGLVHMVIHHGTRCGRSPAVNAGARYARGDLILAMDPDTVFAPTTLARLAAAFRDPRVAAACCNLGVSNEDASLSTALQGIEYLMSISAGKSFLSLINAISCCSGACSMYRRDIFVQRGGLDPGPGEDLEMTLRLRRYGYRVRFVPDAWAETAVPDNPVSLIRQRQRWTGTPCASGSSNTVKWKSSSRRACRTRCSVSTSSSSISCRHSRFRSISSTARCSSGRRPCCSSRPSTCSCSASRCSTSRSPACCSAAP
jgi:cellulose synthase/poly-beta-1,6-N-acetylglucosamine synthase-like glycosyltransferase